MMLTFGVLAWGFWELSGGADFVPESRQMAAAAAAEAPQEELVTRASSMTTSISLSQEAEAAIVPSSLSTDDTSAQSGTPTVELAAAEVRADTEAQQGGQQVYLFESLVQGAPRAADILPDTEIAVILPEGAELPEAEPASAPVSGDIRQVAGSRVNMRSGPGTSYGVVNTLNGGTDVEVFEVNANGWARLRNIATGQEGWMAERLLTDG